MMFVADKIPIDEVYDKAFSLFDTDDPSALAYGICVTDKRSHILYKKFRNGCPKSDEAVTITYNKQE